MLQNAEYINNEQEKKEKKKGQGKPGEVVGGSERKRKVQYITGYARRAISNSNGQ